MYTWMYTRTVATQEDGESHKKCIGTGCPLEPDGEGLCGFEAAKQEWGKEREKLARRVKKLEQENADVVEGYEYEVQQLLGRNAALEMEVESLSAELDLHLKAKSSDRYGRYDSATFKPTSRHQQRSYSSKPSPSHCKVTPERSQSHKNT